MIKAGSRSGDTKYLFNSKVKHVLLVSSLLFISQLLLSGYKVLAVLYVKKLKLDIFFVVLCRCLISSLTTPMLAIIFERKYIKATNISIKEWIFFVFGFLSVAGGPIMSLKIIELSSACFEVIIKQLVPLFSLIMGFLLKIKEIRSLRTNVTIIEINGIFIGFGCAIAINIIGFKNPTEKIPLQNWLYSGLIGIASCFIFSLNQNLQFWIFYKDKISHFNLYPLTQNAYSTIVGGLLYCVATLPYLIVNPNVTKIPPQAAIPILYTSILLATVSKGIISWCNKNSSPIVVGACNSLQVPLSFVILKILVNDVMFKSQYILAVGVMIGVLMVFIAPILVKQRKSDIICVDSKIY